MIQFIITHQHPLDQCSGARLLVITAMTQTPLAQRGTTWLPLTVPAELAEQPVATTLLHTLSESSLFPEQGQPVLQWLLLLSYNSITGIY